MSHLQNLHSLFRPRAAFVAFALLAQLTLAACSGLPASATSSGVMPRPSAPGNLVMVGGGPRPDSIMKKVIELSQDGSILIIPMASAEPEATGQAQRQQLLDLGASRVDVLMLSEQDKVSSATAGIISSAQGIWLSGGDQNRLMEFVGDGLLRQAFHQAYSQGAVIAGTSAGTAVMSRTMITGDELFPSANGNFAVLSAGNVIVAEGLGLLPELIVDQHFIVRNRLNRLISVLLDNPERIAAGIDEATALWCRGDGRCLVLGESQIILLIQHHNAHQSNLSATYPLAGNGRTAVPALQAARGIELHVLPPGSQFRVTGGTITELTMPIAWPGD
jgi:cyanophycinase